MYWGELSAYTKHLAAMPSNKLQSEGLKVGNLGQLHPVADMIYY